MLLNITKQLALNNIRSLQIQKCFKFSSSAKLTTTPGKTTEDPKKSWEDNTDFMSKIKLGPREKRFLVLSGKYKRIEDVPEYGSQKAVEKARSIVRIKTNLFMMVVCAMIFGLGAYLGKRDVKQGKTMEDIVYDRRKYYEQPKEN